MSILFIFLINGLLVLNESNHLSEKFEEFINKYNKTYKSDLNEYKRRFNIFQESLDRINRLNQQRLSPGSAIYGITQFSDLTANEFEILIRKRIKSNISNRRRLNERSVSGAIDYQQLVNHLKDVPKKWDYREKNVITKVRNQGECGACWAHSIVETIEAMVALKTHKLQDYSVQQFVDCTTEGNKGCDGGDTCAALVWMAENNIKVMTETQYPTISGVGKCKVERPEHGISILGNFTCDNLVGKEERMIRLLATHGPLVVAVDAKTWQHYLGGVIQYHCDDDLNHAVQIVGYDLTGDIPYYIVRNTWDTTFGIDGYMHVAIGGDLCGIAQEVSAFDVQIS